jgi:hypothetical protein
MRGTLWQHGLAHRAKLKPRGRSVEEGSVTMGKKVRNGVGAAKLTPERLRTAVATISEVAALWEKGLMGGMPEEAQAHHRRLLEAVVAAADDHWETTPVGRDGRELVRLRDLQFFMLRTLLARELWMDREAGRSDEDMVRMVQGVLQRFWYMSVSPAEILDALRHVQGDIRSRARWVKEPGGPVTAAGKVIARLSGVKQGRPFDPRSLSRWWPAAMPTRSWSGWPTRRAPRRPRRPGWSTATCWTSWAAPPRWPRRWPTW